LAFALRPGGPAVRLLDAARSAPCFEQLELEPLGHEASVALLAEIPDPALRERLAREAAGSPFFLGELARVASRSGDGLPGTVLAAVGQEVAALPGSSRSLLEGAAVAGDPFDPELAAAAAGTRLDPDALDRLVAADLVRASGSGRQLAFRHPLIRRAVYDLVAPAWRLGAHERADGELERRGAAVIVRAHHVARFARPGDAAAVALLSQAAEAAARSAPTIAARWYGAALRLLADSDRDGRLALLVPFAGALSSAGQLRESRNALEQALGLLEPGEPRWLELSVICARVETQLSRHLDAQERLLAVRAAAPRERAAALDFELAAGAFHQGRVSELRGWADPALEAAVEADEPLLQAGAAALAALGAFWTGDAHRSAACLDRATALLSELDDRALTSQLTVAAYVGIAQYLAERFADAAATAGRAVALCRRGGHGQPVVTLLGLRAKAQMHLLELDAALQAAETAEEIARLQRLPHALHFALWARALVHDQRDERDDAERCAREGARLTGQLEPTKRTRTAACDFAALDHDPERAIREMTASAGPQLERADPTWRSWLLLRLVRAMIATGATDDAHELAELALAHTAALQLPAGAARAACAHAEALLARGQSADAAALATHAATSAERIPAPLDALDARLLAGRATATAGQIDVATAMLKQTAADADRHGALRVHRAAAQQLRRLGTRTPQALTPGPLTVRERDVADLVAGGHSNKEVAATLYLSEKTVANTLTRVYAKLGLRCRSQLARALPSEP
jgi:DNA-binding NarL/FixJ family response regulator